MIECVLQRIVGKGAGSSGLTENLSGIRSFSLDDQPFYYAKESNHVVALSVVINCPKCFGFLDSFECVG
jgi:hypothetical protein